VNLSSLWLRSTDEYLTSALDPNEDASSESDEESSTESSSESDTESDDSSVPFGTKERRLIAKVKVAQVKLVRKLKKLRVKKLSSNSSSCGHRWRPSLPFSGAGRVADVLPALPSWVGG